VNAAKERYGDADLESLFEGAKKVVAMKGKKVTVLDLGKDPEAMSELGAVALGPTGNLRAPTLRVGKTWLIGFNEEEYERLLG
jgi:arsenate reductase-like glutaredoxin family protein